MLLNIACHDMIRHVHRFMGTGQGYPPDSRIKYTYDFSRNNCSVYSRGSFHKAF